MARTGKYTHGKTKGTSDRQSSGRLSSAGGETSTPIKEFKISGSTNPSQPIRVSTNDYYRSQALTYPQAPQIKSFSEAPANDQNLKNLVKDLGEVNTKLQQFTPDFWNFQKAMDKAARGKAEEKAAESNTQLNAAKNALEKKAETDENASDSYGIFSSMDQRVERELVIVNAKNKGLALVSGFNDVALNDYNASSLDESRIDEQSGEIIPINPSTEEWSNYATNYFKNNIDNTAAYLELQPQIQAAIYSARRTLSKEHATYKDNKANSTFNTSIGSIIIEASTASQNKITGYTIDSDGDTPAQVIPGMNFSGAITDFNQKSGTSIKNYQKQVEPNALLTTIANGVILNSNTENLNDNADIALTLLKNTRIGAGNGQLLSEIVGGEQVLENMWELAIGAERNEAQRIRDGNNKNTAGNAARIDYANINQQDADLKTPEIDPILNGQDQRTVVVDDVEYYIDSGPNAINLSGVVSKIDQLLFDADKKFSTGIEAYEYRQELLRLKKQFLDTRTAGQREENYQWLKKRITENPDQATLNKSLLNYFFRTDRISRDQYGLLEPDININYTNEKSIFNDEMNGKNGGDGKIATATGYIEAYYRDKTGKTMKSFDEWDPEDKNAYLARVAKFKREANAIFLLPIPLEERLEKLNELTSKLDTEMQNASTKLKQNKTGINKDKNIQVGTNKDLTNNNEGDDNNNEGSTQFTYQTPKELITSLDGRLNGRGNDQQNSALATAVREDTLYSTPILVKQLEMIEEFAVVLENKNWTGKNLPFWNWVPTAETPVGSGFGTPQAKNLLPRALVYGPETKAILSRISKDMSPKEYFTLQAKLHNRPLSAKFYERLDRVFPDERNDQFQFEGAKKNNEVSSSILDRGTLVASTDLTGVLKKEPTPPPRIDPSDNTELYPEGIETGSYTLPKDVTDDKEFVSAVEKLSSDLDIPVNYLWAVMGFETGGTYDPGQYNIGKDGTKESGSGAVGLIQFMPDTLKEWGVTTEEAANMTRVEQLELVAKHLKRWTRPGDDFKDVYMSILFPVAAGKPNDYVLFTKGTKEKPNTRYDQNSGLDKNGDGTITKEEAASSILQYLPPLPVKEVPKNKDSSTIGGRSNIA